MYQMIRRWVGVIAIALFLSILHTPQPARAHDGPPRLELTSERLNPGATLEIRGINIAAEQPITLALVGAGAEFALGTAMGDEHGDFKLIVDVPAEAAVGSYNVRAFAPNRVVVAVPLILAGSLISVEGSEHRDQDEPLLAPMPQTRPVQSAQPQQPIAQPSAPAAGLWYGLAAFGVLLVVAGAAFAWRWRTASTGEVSG